MNKFCTPLILFGMLFAPMMKSEASHELWKEYDIEPLSPFVRAKTDEEMEALIAQGEDINARENGIGYTFEVSHVYDGETPLMSSYSIKTHKRLLRYGADFTATNRIGKNMLMDAAYKDEVELVKLYLRLGIDVHAMDNYRDDHHLGINRDIFEYAIVRTPDSGIQPNFMSDFLKDYIASDYQIELLYEQDAETGEMIPFPPLLYHHFMKDASKEKIEALIAAGADVNVRNAGGQTPLMIASLVGNREAMGVLLINGADASLYDYRGLTASIPVAVTVKTTIQKFINRW